MSLFHVSPKRGRQFCNVVVVICGRRRSTAATNAGESANGGARRFAEEESSRSVREFKEAAARRNFEVQVLEPSGKEELQQRLEILQPTVVYFCTDIYSTKHDFGSLVIGDSEVCSADDIALLFRGKLPNLVCLEISESFKLGEGLCSKGIPYVVAWKAYLTAAIVTSFRQAFLPALQCTGSELWDAFQVSKAAFQLHCIQPNPELSRNGKQKVPSFLPVLLGKSPKVTFNHLALKDTSEEGIKSIAPGAIQIFEDPTEIRLLLSDRIGTEETVFLPALQDGLNALLTAEVRSVRLMHRMSAPLPPAAASALVRGMVTMRCDVCTSNFARISFIVSGSAEICLKDEFLEHCIRMELASRSQFLQFVTSLDSGSALRPGMLGTSCIASGASTVEASIKTSAWAGQILRQLALQSSYLNLVSLGVAGVDGVSVAAFQTRDSGIGAMPKCEEDREQYSKREYESATGSSLPTWLSTPPPRRKRTHIVSDGSVGNDCNELDGSCRNQIFSLTSEDPTISGRDRLTTGMASSGSSRWKRQCLLAKLKPVPHSNKVKLMPFGTFVGGLPTSNARKPSVVNGGVGKGHHFNGSSSPTAAANDGNYPGAAVVPPQHALALGCSATRKHGCVRPSLEECTEEEFLEDLMQFLVSRGHGRLIPTTGIDAFPNVVLNGKKLDLYNLYREVVTRGGFYVGNGINWKGQIFPKMRNHTLTNRITGVGNTLKRHYETYLLEYELAHDDVGGECCVLCFSGAEGDWVNCGVCRQWAHFGCDRRTGLGAFKDYAKTDGLEYICPRCSIRVMPRAKDGDRPR